MPTMKGMQLFKFFVRSFVPSKLSEIAQHHQMDVSELVAMLSGPEAPEQVRDLSLSMGLVVKKLLETQVKADAAAEVDAHPAKRSRTAEEHCTLDSSDDDTFEIDLERTTLVDLTDQHFWKDTIAFTQNGRSLFRHKTSNKVFEKSVDNLHRVVGHYDCILKKAIFTRKAPPLLHRKSTALAESTSSSSSPLSSPKNGGRLHRVEAVADVFPLLSEFVEKLFVKRDEGVLQLISAHCSPDDKKKMNSSIRNTVAYLAYSDYLRERRPEQAAQLPEKSNMFTESVHVTFGDRLVRDRKNNYCRWSWRQCEDEKPSFAVRTPIVNVKPSSM